MNLRKGIKEKVYVKLIFRDFTDMKIDEDGFFYIYYNDYWQDVTQEIVDLWESMKPKVNI